MARTLRVIGIVAVVIGIVLILNVSDSFTGFAVLESISGGASSVLGVVFVIGGILLWTFGRMRFGDSEFRDAVRWDFKRNQHRDPKDENELNDYAGRTYKTDMERRELVEDYRTSRQRKQRAAA